MRPRRKRSRAADPAPAPAADAGPSDPPSSSKDSARRSLRRTAFSALESAPTARRTRQVSSKRQRVRGSPAPREAVSRVRTSILRTDGTVDRELDQGSDANPPKGRNPRSQDTAPGNTDTVIVDEAEVGPEEVRGPEREIQNPDHEMQHLADTSACTYERTEAARVQSDRGFDGGFEAPVPGNANEVLEESDALLENVNDLGAEIEQDDEDDHANEHSNERNGENMNANEVEEHEPNKNYHAIASIENDAAAEGHMTVCPLPLSPPPRKKSAVLLTQHQDAPLRSQALLELLRNDESLCDGVIVAGNRELRIHCAIVAPLSPFFATALSGDFAEAQQRRLIIPDASGDAMSVILDYAYGIEIEEELSEKPELALEVWKLAHRFTIDVLREIAAREALSGVSVEASIRFFHETELYGSEKEIEIMFLFIARNFYDVSQRCEQFCDLSVDFMLEFLCSKELIVSEWEKFQAIMVWVKADLDKRGRFLEDLLHYVRFPLMNREWMMSAMKDIELLPKEVLSKAIMQAQHSGYLTNGHVLNQMDHNGSRGKNTAGWPRGAEFMMRMSCGKGGNSPRKETPFYFELHHWVISARIVHCIHGITLDFEFEQRLRRETILEELGFEEDVQQHEFMINVRLCSGGSVSNENLWFKTPKTRGGKARLILMEEDVAASYFKDVGQGMNIVVSMQCKRKVKYWARAPIRGSGRGGYSEMGPDE